MHTEWDDMSAQDSELCTQSMHTYQQRTDPLSAYWRGDAASYSLRSRPPGSVQ